MDEVIIDGKKFISSSRAASEFGYTADYIGQLSRAKKIESRQIGRAWYVLEASIRKHKEGHGEHELGNLPAAQITAPHPEPRIQGPVQEPARAVFGDVEKKVVPGTRYEHDARPLLPVLAKTDSIGRNDFPLQKFGAPEAHVPPFRKIGKGYSDTRADRMDAEDSPQDFFPASDLYRNIQTPFLRMPQATLFGFFFVTVVGVSIFSAQLFSIPFTVVKNTPTSAAVVARFDAVRDTRSQEIAAVSSAVAVRFDAAYGKRPQEIAAAALPENKIADVRLLFEGAAVGVFHFFSDAEKNFAQILAFFFSPSPAPVALILPAQTGKPVIARDAFASSGSSVAALPPPKSAQGATPATSAVQTAGQAQTVQIIERAVASGLTASYIDEKLQELNNKLSSQIYAISAQSGGNTTRIVEHSTVIAQTNRIDKLDRTTITNPTISGAVITSSSFSGSSGTFTGAVSAGSLSVSGEFTLGGLTVTGNSSLSGNLAVGTSGLVFNSTTGNVGIGTTTPYARLSVVGEVVASSFTATSTTATSTIASTLLLTHAPTIPHTFSPWAIGTANANPFDASFVINPASATADSNLFSALVNGSIKFLIDAEGDVFTNSLTSIGSVTLSNTTASTFSVEGNTTLGDSITDTTTINGTLTVTGTTTASTVAGNFGVGTTSPWARLSVAGRTGDTTTPLFTISTSTSSGTSTAVFVDAYGRFGIGTSSPSATFAVEGNAYINGVITTNLTTSGAVDFSGTGTTTFGGGIQAAALAATNYVQSPFFIATSTTATSTFAGGFAIETSGFVYDFSTNRVGIGTAAPANTLTVSGGADFTGNVGIGTTTPWGKLSVEMDTTNPSFVVSNQGSSTPAFYISGVNQDGRIGIGTSAPGTRLDVLDVSGAQLRLSQTTAIYSELTVAASTGDLTVALYPSTTGNDIFFTQPSGTTGANVWACSGTACPVTLSSDVTVSTGGNFIAENGYYLGNGFRIDQVAGTTTEIAVYNASSTAIVIFDQF